MRRYAIRLALVLAILAIASQFVLPPVLENRVEGRLTDHGGTASVDLAAIPALELLFGQGDKIVVRANGLSVDVTRDQEEAFKQLDDFDDVDIFISDSRAGPLSVDRFTIRRTGEHEYAVTIVGDGT